MKRIISRFFAMVAFSAASVSVTAQTVTAVSSFERLSDYGTVALDFNQNYGHTFINKTFNTSGLTNPITSSVDTGFFKDYYQFTTPTGTFNTIAATINLAGVLAIDNLQARLYKGTYLAQIGPSVQSWSSPISAGVSTGTVSVINPVLVGTASVTETYTLELRGVVTGMGGGSYGGALNIVAGDVTAVPEPESYALMLAGLAMIGGMVVRRRKMI